MEPLPRALFQLAVVGQAEPARVVSFRGREEISALYRHQIQIAVSESAEDVGAALLGQRVALLFRSDGEVVRVLHGIAVHVESQGGFLDDRSGLALTVVPAMSRLKRRRTRRIFQHRSSLDIASQLLTPSTACAFE
jgi:type VI secretion system secreted protein VgrG